MKFGKFIDYKMRNIFLGKSCTRCGEGPSPRTFYKKSKLHISGSVVWNVTKFVFIVCPSRGLPIKVPTTSFTSCKALKKQKEFLNKSSYLIFCIIFEEKYFRAFQLSEIVSDMKVSLWIILSFHNSMLMNGFRYTVEPVLKTTSIKQPLLHNNHSQVRPSNIW